MRTSCCSTILNSAKDGLDPTDYDAAGLMAAMRHQRSRRYLGRGDRAVQQAVVRLRARPCPRQGPAELAHPRRGPRRRPAGYLAPQPRSPSIASARRCTGLLPTHPQYAALKKALELTPKTEIDKINRIRLNMDRWRWLPRDLGERYIIVNVPAFTAALVENGVTVSRHVAVAGAIKTPTPQLMAMATGVILNPWWEVPPSITKEVARQAGLCRAEGSQDRQAHPLAPAAGPAQRARADQVRDVQSAQHLSARHDGARASSTRRCAPTATAASAPSTSCCSPSGC